MINPTEYLPKSYHTRVSTYWWLARWAYLKFILREASSVFVAWIVVVTLLQIRALTRGPADYAAFQKWLQSPLLLALNAVPAATADPDQPASDPRTRRQPVTSATMRRRG